MTSFSFRKADLGDAHALDVLVNSAYRGDSSRKGWTTEADLLDGQRTDIADLQAMIFTQDQVILLAESPERSGTGLISGCVYLRKIDATHAYIGMVTVDPGLQNSGLGRTLLNQAEAFSQKQWGSQFLQMTVISIRSELVAWYERRGYQKNGQMESFPYGNPRFGLPRRQDLEFVVLEKKLSV